MRRVLLAAPFAAVEHAAAALFASHFLYKQQQEESSAKRFYRHAAAAPVASRHTQPPAAPNCVPPVSSSTISSAERVDPKEAVEDYANIATCVVLDPAQEAAVADVIHKGRNVFITGGAGTGKSVIVRELAKRLPKHSTFLTGTTGVAAMNVGGTTLHSFAGIGMGAGSATQLAFAAHKNRLAARRWLICRTLIIDEVSMLSAQLLDSLNRVAQLLRNDERPFGGVQVVFCGDFLQLPPIVGGEACDYAFQAATWKALKLKVHLLKWSYRQAADNILGKILADMRLGHVTDESHKLLAARIRPLSEKVDPRSPQFGVQLRGTNREVDLLNFKHLKELPPNTQVPPWKPADLMEEQRPYTMTYTALDHTKAESAVVRNCMLPLTLEAKIGCQVMLLTNVAVSSGLVNGTVGEVIGFLTPLELLELAGLCEYFSVPRGSRDALKKWDFPEAVKNRFRYLMCQGFGVTLKKSDPSNEEIANLILECQTNLKHLYPTCSNRPVIDTKEGSQPYMAVRAGSIAGVVKQSLASADGGQLSPSDPLVSEAALLSSKHRLFAKRNASAVEGARLLIQTPNNTKEGAPKPPCYLPIVRVNHETSERSLPNAFLFGMPLRREWLSGGKLVAFRIQLPLRLSWAVTIHKSQGLSLDRVHVDLRRVFEKGQTYVALSRARTLKGLYIDGFTLDKVQACPVASCFYSNLEKQQENDGDGGGGEDQPTSSIPSVAPRSRVLGLSGILEGAGTENFDSAEYEPNKASLWEEGIDECEFRDM